LSRKVRGDQRGDQLQGYAGISRGGECKPKLGLSSRKVLICNTLEKVIHGTQNPDVKSWP